MLFVLCFVAMSRYTRCADIDVEVFDADLVHAASESADPCAHRLCTGQYRFVCDHDAVRCIFSCALILFSAET